MVLVVVLHLRQQHQEGQGNRNLDGEVQRRQRQARHDGGFKELRQQRRGRSAQAARTCTPSDVSTGGSCRFAGSGISGAVLQQGLTRGAIFMREVLRPNAGMGEGHNLCLLKWQCD